MIMKPFGVNTSGLDRVLKDAEIADKLKSAREKKGTVEDLKKNIGDIVDELDQLQAGLLLENVTAAKEDALGVEMISSFLKTGPSTIETDIAEIGRVQDAKVLADLESALHDYAVGDHLSEEQIRFMDAVSQRKRELLD